MEQRLEERKHSSYLLMIVWREEEEGGDKYNNAGQGEWEFYIYCHWYHTIMNIMKISVILKNWNRSQNTFPDK